MKNGVKVYGGFSGNESVASDSDPAAHRTFIRGGENVRAVVSIDTDASTVLRGFVIHRGVMYDPTQAGGGMYLKRSDMLNVQCDFTNNSAVYAGGAVAVYGGARPTFVNCRFFANGGVNGHPRPVGGGAVFNRSGSPKFINCLFYDNTANDGGAVVTLAGRPAFLNCTIVNNRAVARRGGAIFDSTARAVVRNSILWNDTAFETQTNELFNDESNGTSDVAYTLVAGGFPGVGNIDADPSFVDVDSADFHLRAESPCIGAGQLDDLPNDLPDLNWNNDTNERVPFDLALTARFRTNTIDLGAFAQRNP